MMENIRANAKLDTKGFACPMPIVKTKKTMNNLEAGQVLEVQATDDEFNDCLHNHTVPLLCHVKELFIKSKHPV